MKKNLLFVIVFVCIGLVTFSQAPSSIPYQAVARDASGNLLQNTTICVQYRVYNAATGGTLLYEEHQQAVTNKLGLFSVNIGSGGSYDGGSNTSLGTINWGSNSVYVEIGLDITGGCTGSNTYTNMGRSQMMSVPFALYAGSAASASGAAGGDLTGNYPNPTLAATGVTANTYGTSSTYPVVTVDAKGRVTNVTTDALPVVGFTNGPGISVTGVYPNFTIANTSLSSGGTVTGLSVASANGLAGSSSGGTTPQLTLSTTITGMLKGNGTAISAGTAGTDYVIPSGSITGSAGSFTGNLSGDVTGSQSATKVTGIQGIGVTTTTPSTGNVLEYNGSNWTPAAASIAANGAFILNQTAQQSSSNFSISGNGTVGGVSIHGTGDGTGTVAGGTVRAPNASGASNVTGANLTIASGAGTGTGNAGSIVFQTAPASGSSSSTTNTLTTDMTILSGGNVGIGYTSPLAALTVSNTNGSALSSTGGNGTTGATNTTFTTYSGTLGTTASSYLKLANFGFSSANQSSLGIKALRTVAGSGWNPGTAIGFEMDVDVTDNASGGSLWLNSNGFVGIGTSTPTATLTVLDAGNSNKLSGTLTVMANNLTAGVSIGYAGITSVGNASNLNNPLFIGAEGTGNVLIQTQTSAGNVGIGAANTAPLSVLSVGGAGNALWEGYFNNATTSSNYTVGVYGQATTNSNSNTSYGVQGNSTPTSATGYSVGVYGTAIGASLLTNGRAYGVRGMAGNATTGYNYGVFGDLEGTGNGAAIYGLNGAGGATTTTPIPATFAGWFDGNVNVNGFLGVGTTTPLAPIYVTTSSNSTVAGAIQYVNPGNTGNNNQDAGYNSSWTGAVSIYAAKNIVSSASCIAISSSAYSDNRIKNIIGVSDGREDLEKINKIQITKYKYIDSISVGNFIRTKVIAQQVEKVYPEAVSQISNYIPNIYALSQALNYDSVAHQLTITMDKPHNLSLADKVKLIGEGNNETIAEVKAVNSAYSFTVPCNRAPDKLFVYGKEVKDFRVVDYEALSMLGISALQEISRKVDALELANKTLQNKNKELELDKADKRDTELKYNELKAQVDDLKSLMEKNGIRSQK